MTKSFSGVVHPWLCDAMGHLNTRNYVAMFDDATYVILAHLGYRPGERLGRVDVRNETDYLTEVLAGSVVEISSSISKIGTKSLTIDSEMRSVDGKMIHARMRAVRVHFDLEQRLSMPMSEDIRQKAHALVIG